MAATKSMTFPPMRPPRAAEQEAEWQAQAFLSTLTTKLRALLPDR